MLAEYDIILLDTPPALGYLTIVTRCEALGRDLRELDATLDEYQRRLSNEQYKWSQAIAPANLKTVLLRNNLYMNWPQPEQVVRFEPVRHDLGAIAADAAIDVRMAGLTRTALNE